MKSVVTGTAIALNIATSLIGHEEVQSINARELHEQLQSKQQFGDWIRNRLETYGFVDWEDFIINLWKTSKLGGRPKKDYILTLDTAKEIAMVENNEQGRKIRKYLIQIEKEYREQKTSHHTLSTLNFNYSEDIPMNFTAKDISTLGVKFYQAMSRIAEKMEEQQEYIEYLEKWTELLAEQHEIIEQLTVENAKLSSQDPADKILSAIEELTGQKMLIAPPQHITIKGYLSSIRVKLSPGNVLRLSHIARQMCTELGKKIAKIPDERYGFLNLYPQEILQSAFEQMELS